jgi:hypothetical protein
MRLKNCQWMMRREGVGEPFKKKEKISPITKQFVEKHADELAMAMK